MNLNKNLNKIGNVYFSAVTEEVDANKKLAALLQNPKTKSYKILYKNKHYPAREVSDNGYIFHIGKNNYIATLEE